MTGLNLETFLHLLRADLGAWVTLGLIGLVLALMTWTSWGSRRVLRKCLVLSIIAHAGLVLYGSTVPVLLLTWNGKDRAAPPRERIQRIKVAPMADVTAPKRADGRNGQRGDRWDLLSESLALAEPKVAPKRPDKPTTDALEAPPSQAAPPPAAEPDVNPAASKAPEPTAAGPETAAPEPDEALPSLPGEIAAPIVARAPDAETESSPLDRGRGRRPADPGAKPRNAAQGGRVAAADPAPPESDVMPLLEAPTPRAGAAATIAERGTNSESTDVAGATTDRAAAADPTASGVPGRIVRRAEPPPAEDALDVSDLRRLSRPSRTRTNPAGRAPEHRAEELGALALTRATPGGLPRLPEIQGAIGGRPLNDVPEVYRSRLDPNRSALAKRAGASNASEQAVERALDWLARHQDSDGRWDAGTKRLPDGTPIDGDDDFTVHCPAGEPCIGECIYWEADTGLTGLALLAFLGSGYTHTDGKYTETVGKGLDFLRAVQKPDGDLRYDSKAVGMYCHAMAALALCEAYALTGDVRLKDPVERALGFLVRARARDGQSWRYSPGAAQGDTSILGWVVMALKSGKEVGIPIPASVQSGTLGWLRRVSSGGDRGLASYLPGQPPTPTMTAEAWVCRQFLGVGGPSPASTEAADELLANGPGRPGRDGYNLYYWYYGTLAMYQYGGAAWSRWNAQVRDQVVRRQRLDGHRAGSWDPDDSDYGARGGRIYCTALATLTLEVYYRFLRLYDEPETAPIPLPRAPGRFRAAPARDRS
jgi:hypothetical protein